MIESRWLASKLSVQIYYLFILKIKKIVNSVPELMAVTEVSDRDQRFELNKVCQ